MVTTGVFVQKDNPPYVTFHRKAVEDIAGSRLAGRSMTKDVDFAHITPHGSKDILIKKITDWLPGMVLQVKRGQMSQTWHEHYLKAHQAWVNGQELPVNGIPIKGWSVISPSQQENLVRMEIRTVEDLASINGEGLSRIGMGAVSLKHKAQAWLQQAEDKGPLTLEMAGLKQDNALLTANLGSLTETIEQLQLTIKGLEQGFPRAGGTLSVQPDVETTAITAFDILGDASQPDTEDASETETGVSPSPRRRRKKVA
jgi:hypothetical protein